MRNANFLIIFILCVNILTFAQNQPPEKKTYYTQRITGTLPVIDGRLDDAAWKQAKWEDGFIQRQPYENAAPSQKTAFEILYDDNNLYVAIRAYDSLPDKIVTRLSRRDNNEGDMVGIQFDSHGDKLTCYDFFVSASGVKNDGFISDDGNNEDMTFDPIWYVKTSVDSLGWCAEMKIPLSQLRFSKANEQVWGLQVGRYLHRKEEYSWWQHIPKDATGWTHLAGELRGIRDIKPKKQFEIQPYLVGKYETDQKDNEDPFSKAEKTKASAGVDGKIGITNDLTLDFSVNPDFGQVEADPSEVNLSGFETYYQEKRPFFIEGKNILSFTLTPGNNGFSLDNLFYTRRIGRNYQRDMDDFDYVDSPDNTTILGAFKLSGKTKNGLSIGILESVTQRETAKTVLGDVKSTEVVEPFTNYFIGRLQKDIDKGNTRIGGMFTATNRDLNDPGLKFLPQSAYTGGLDFDHSWKNKTYNLSLKAVFSLVQGDSSAITRLQRSSVRYFQRPDANYVSLDSNRTRLAGNGGIISFSKLGKGHWKYQTWVNWRSPGLELNDVGYLRRTDDIFQVIWVGYHYWKPFSIFREINVNFNQWTGWDFGGNSTYKGGNVNFSNQFKNYWYFNCGINIDLNNIDNSVLRGGPSMKIPGGWNYWFSVATDQRKKFTADAYASAYYGFDDWTANYNYGFDLSYKPWDALSITVNPDFSINKSGLQYIDTKNFGTSKRYILGSIDQNTLRLSLRLDYCLTPNLTLQYYGQPFIATGKYTSLKRITDPKNNNYRKSYQLYNNRQLSYNADDNVFTIDENEDGTMDYSFDNPDFKYLDFISNLVLRWEYIPGSTIYLVWSQNRSDSFDNGRFYPDTDMNNVFRLFPKNIFLIKFSYRFRA